MLFHIMLQDVHQLEYIGTYVEDKNKNKVSNINKLPDEEKNKPPLNNIKQEEILKNKE